MQQWVEFIKTSTDILSEEIAGPVDKIIPVDAKVPGCAVRSEYVISGLVRVLPLLLNAE